MNEAERKIYTELVHFLGQALGPNTEVVLQDISSQSTGIAAIENGHISRRQVGDGPSDFILQMMEKENGQCTDTDTQRLNFSTVARNGRVLRSSTLFIRDENNKLSGMLCINKDVSGYLDICDQIRKLEGLDGFTGEETEDTSDIYLIPTKDAVLDNVRSILREMNIDTPLNRLNAKEKQDVIAKLRDYGIFNLKGAVAEIAAYMEISEPSVYRYLNKNG